MSSSVAPPPPPPPPSGPAPPSATVTIPQAPDALLRLPQGQAVEVRLLEMTRQGLAQLDGGTEFGRFSMRTALTLPEGSKVLLQMLGTRGDSAQMKLIGLNDKPLAQGLQDLAAQGRGARPGMAAPVPSGAATSGGAVPSGAVTLSLGTGTVLDGTVLRTPPGGLGLGQGQAPLTAGTPITLRVAPQAAPLPGAGAGAGTPPAPPGMGGAAAPTGSPTPATQPAGGQTPTPAAPAPTQAAAPTGTAPQGPTAPAPAAGQGPTPTPGQPAPQSPPGPPPAPSSGGGQGGQGANPQTVPGGRPLATLAGQVTANTAAGTTMVRTGDSLIAVNSRTELPAGTTVGLEIVGRGTPPPPSLPVLPLSQPLASLPAGAGASAWPTLSESLDYLSRTDPQAARQLASALPAADQRLVANSLAFAAAQRAGDLRPWLGEGPLKALERAGSRGRQLGQKLDAEFKEMSARPRETGGEWRVLQMPFASGATIDRIEVITRRLWGQDKDEDEQQNRRGGREGGQRFLINVTFSQLGPFQLDGLFKAKKRTMDVVIRTTEDLPEDARRQIKAIHARSIQALELVGAVTFHVTDRFPGPGEEPPDGGGGMGGQSLTA